MYRSLGIYTQKVLLSNSAPECLINKSIFFLKNFKISCSSRTCTPFNLSGSQSAQTLYYFTLYYIILFIYITLHYYGILQLALYTLHYYGILQLALYILGIRNAYENASLHMQP